MKKANVSERVIIVMIYQKCCSPTESLNVMSEKSEDTVTPLAFILRFLTVDPIDESDDMRFSLSSSFCRLDFLRRYYFLLPVPDPTLAVSFFSASS